MSLKERLGFDTEPLYLMDGTAFIYRGFFANANMTRSDGLPTGAVYIVGRVLLKLLKEERPTHFAFIMDGPGRNFRHELFPAYKANRPSAPEGLIAQIEPVKRMVRSLGLHVEVSDGCEADDCLAALAHRFRTDRPVVIIGLDKDLRQCLSDNVVLWDPASRDERLVTLASFREETGLEPGQWPDVQALVGDSSDNVPGVRGVGQKTAEKLFHEFPNLEALRDGFDNVAPSVKKKLEGNLEAMFLYRQLTTLDVTRCTALTLDDLRIHPMQGREALTLFHEFEMGSLNRQLTALVGDGVLSADESGIPASRSVKSGPSQLSLFGENAAPEPSLPQTSSVAALPSCAGRVVALTPPPALHDRHAGGVDSLFAVAVSETSDFMATPPSCEAVAVQGETLYGGSTANLAAWAAQAALVVTPDVKKLLHENDAWAALPPEQWFDLGLAAYLLAPEDRDYGWPRLSARHAEMCGISLERPASLALALCRDEYSRLEHAELTPLLQHMELPLVPVLTDMERAGVRVDLTALQEFLLEVETEINSLTERIYKEAEGPFNIRSAQQLGEVLFKRLNLPTARATKGGQASTSQDVLEKLSGAHPVVDALLEFRKLEKLRSTYLDPLPRLAGPDGRIHTTFNQMATATGRLSSSNPNLQNIPVRGDLGRRMRTCFTAGPGNALVSADYSQIELRVLAHYSQDPTLVEAFRNGEDIHTRTAALLHDADPASITPDQRRRAKTINFGLIYGMGARKLAQDLAISQAEAKTFMDRYFARFAHIKEFFDRVEEQAREQGYVTTLSGRRRPLPDMLSQSAQSRALAERQAVNTLIQGSAADIIKAAMLAVHRDDGLRALSARLILQVHDELVLEAPEDKAKAAGERVAVLMTDLGSAGMALAVPLVADWGYGPHWGSAH